MTSTAFIVASHHGTAFAVSSTKLPVAALPVFAELAKQATPTNFPLQHYTSLTLAQEGSATELLSQHLTTATTATATAATKSFAPVAPDAAALAGFAAIAVVCAAAGWVWSNQVVPVSRTNLALSKKSGPVRDYLDELNLATTTTAAASAAAAAAFNNNSTITATTDAGGAQLVEEQSNASVAAAAVVNIAKGGDKAEKNRALERWLFADWLRQRDPKKPGGGRQKEPALPILKKAKWNSGDNPVLAATALIMLGVVFTSVTERIATTLSF